MKRHLIEERWSPCLIAWMLCGTYPQSRWALSGWGIRPLLDSLRSCRLLFALKYAFGEVMPSDSYSDWSIGLFRICQGYRPIFWRIRCSSEFFGSLEFEVCSLCCRQWTFESSCHLFWRTLWQCLYLMSSWAPIFFPFLCWAHPRFSFWTLSVFQLFAPSVGSIFRLQPSRS